MKEDIYNKIVKEYRKTNHRQAVGKLCAAFPSWPRSTLAHIAAQEFQKLTKRNHWKMRHPDHIASYYKRYSEQKVEKCKPGFLLDMADSHNVAPSLLAKLILEEDLKHKNEGNVYSNKYINNLLKDTSLIEDAVLAVEIHLCILNDYSYGPYTDALSKASGSEYEEKLKNELQELKVNFTDEVELRTKGYDKTPDVKLDVPFAISGHVVNWIESKALFGDPIYHKELLKDQYWSYINRFGPGMVIYWFGFVDELDILSDQGLLLFDHLPKDITYINPCPSFNL